MALLEVETIQSCIKRNGLAPFKSRNLRKMAEIIVEEAETFVLTGTISSHRALVTKQQKALSWPRPR